MREINSRYKKFINDYISIPFLIIDDELPEEYAKAILKKEGFTFLDYDEIDKNSKEFKILANYFAEDFLISIDKIWPNLIDYFIDYKNKFIDPPPALLALMLPDVFMGKLNIKIQSRFDFYLRQVSNNKEKTFKIDPNRNLIFASIGEVSKSVYASSQYHSDYQFEFSESFPEITGKEFKRIINFLTDNQGLFRVLDSQPLVLPSFFMAYYKFMKIPYDATFLALISMIGGSVLSPVDTINFNKSDSFLDKYLKKFKMVCHSTGNIKTASKLFDSYYGLNAQGFHKLQQDIKKLKEVEIKLDSKRNLFWSGESIIPEEFEKAYKVFEEVYINTHISNPEDEI